MIGCRAYYMAQAGKFGDLTLNAKTKCRNWSCILERGLIVDIGQDIFKYNTIRTITNLIT